MQRAKEMGFDAIALTDKNCLYGAVRFYKAARSEAIKPIIGSEVTLWDGTSLILLARCFEGYKNICCTYPKHMRSEIRTVFKASAANPKSEIRNAKKD